MFATYQHHKRHKYMNLEQEHKEIMQQHQARLTNVKKMIRRGDWNAVMEKTGLSYYNVQRSMQRVGSKNHLLVVQTLEEVVLERLSQFKVG
jgi:hypothetical protein